jgi:2,3-bisphosphoglycerate-independent phosphoglycerate mutase
LKYLILLGDGMADWPLPNYGHRTPLEIAHTPAMDAVVSRGITGQFCPIPEGLPAGSDVGNLSLFGYDPRNAFRGRAPIEAAYQGIPVAENQVAFRCNLVCLENGAMKDFTSEHISTEEAALLIQALNETLPDNFPVSFHPGVSYRHLALVDASPDACLDSLVNLNCEPPHNISGQPFAPSLPQGEGSVMVQALTQWSQEFLPTHPVNQARVEKGLLPATSIWLWGQGRAPEMQTFAEKFGRTGAVVSAVDLVKGIGTLAGLEILEVPGATGWLDTNYDGKIQAGLAALETLDFAYVHVEAPDEAGHQGRADLKIQAIEDFDRHIVAPALDYQDTHPECRILVCPDHYTTIKTKTHAGGPLPFALCGPGVPVDTHHSYSETESKKTKICLSCAHPLIEKMLGDKPLDIVSLCRRNKA